MRTKPSLRQIAAVLALVAALAAGSPVLAAPAEASPRPVSGILAGDLLAPLRALLEQAAGALGSLWSAASETGQIEDETRSGGRTSPLPGASDLSENGAGIDPNG